jgi:hypothetical protein
MLWQNGAVEKNECGGNAVVSLRQDLKTCCFGRLISKGKVCDIYFYRRTC